jgi:nucleolar GTP-binding protein
MTAVHWKKLATVPFSDEVLDKGFSKGRQAADNVYDSDKIFRVRKQMSRMIQASADTIAEQLMNHVKSWPSLDQLEVFDRALIDAAVGLDDYKHHLSMLQWGAKQIRSVARQNIDKITKTANIEFMHITRREAYGRISSIIRQISKSLEWLNSARETLKKLPSIDPVHPCIVVAGAPNVGKSALISALSTGNPEVASYPFTTKQLHLGHFEHRRLRYQIVDTPGLLDRPMTERNHIEMQAIAALEHTGSIVLFVMDYSGECGSSIEVQNNLLGEVKELLKQKEIIVLETKADLVEVNKKDWDEVKLVETNLDFEKPKDLELKFLKNEKTGNIMISTKEDLGLKSIKLHIINKIKNTHVEKPLELPEGWYRSDLD